MRKRSLGPILAAAAIGCITWGLSSSIAVPELRTDTQVEAAEADLDAAQAAFEQAQKVEQAAQQRAEQASQAAADAATAAEQATARAERARGQSTAADEAAEQARRTLGQLVANAYQSNSELTRLMELSSGDATQFQQRSSSLSQLMQVQDTVLRQAAESKANADDAASRADGHAASADEAAAAAAELSEQATSLLTDAAEAAETANTELRKVREIYEAAQRAAEERAAAENQPDRGDRGEGEADAPPPPSGDGVFVRPSTGPITSPYGMRVHPLTGVYKLHSGTDFGASCGAGAHAAHAGTVESAAYEGAYGNQVTISHGVIGGMDVTTTYNHLSAFSARPGQSVAAGDLIGRVGTTGSSTGCHLHFEVLVNGRFTDPMGWLS